MKSTWHWVKCDVCHKRYGRMMHYGGSKQIAEKDCKMCKASNYCIDCWMEMNREGER